MSRSIFAMAILSTLLVGCCPNGCFIVTGTAYEELAHPVPYLQQWEKTGVGPETRRQDSRNCGSDLLENIPYPDGISFSKERILSSKLPGESEYETYYRISKDWQRCMLKNGYKYSGKCYDNEISRAMPACGAP